MNVLVTGANGFIGMALCAELQAHQHHVVAVTRTSSYPVAKISHVGISSIEEAVDWSAALFQVDSVVHLAARVHVMKDSAVDPLDAFRKVNVQGTLQLAREAAKAGVKRFIYLSSIKVNGETTEPNNPFTEEVFANPQDAYGISKLEAEQGLLLVGQQTAMEIVIIRPPLVYGPGVKANFASLLRIVHRRIPLPLGAIQNKRSFVYVGNLVSLILCTLEHPAAANQVFLASDDEDISTPELIRQCAKALGTKARLISVPQGLLEWVANRLGKQSAMQRLCGNLQIDSRKANRLLGWTPTYSMSEGLKATALDCFKRKSR